MSRPANGCSECEYESGGRCMLTARSWPADDVRRWVEAAKGPGAPTVVPEWCPWLLATDKLRKQHDQRPDESKDKGHDTLWNTINHHVGRINEMEHTVEFLQDTVLVQSKSLRDQAETIVKMLARLDKAEERIAALVQLEGLSVDGPADLEQRLQAVEAGHNKLWSRTYDTQEGVERLKEMAHAAGEPLKWQDVLERVEKLEAWMAHVKGEK